jgi:hypothetical protein
LPREDVLAQDPPMREIPKPTIRYARKNQNLASIGLRVKPSTRARLVELAEQNGVSLSAFAGCVLDEAAESGFRLRHRRVDHRKAVS